MECYTDTSTEGVPVYKPTASDEYLHFQAEFFRERQDVKITNSRYGRLAFEQCVTLPRDGNER